MVRWSVTDTRILMWKHHSSMGGGYETDEQPKGCRRFGVYFPVYSIIAISALFVSSTLFLRYLLVILDHIKVYTHVVEDLYGLKLSALLVYFYIVLLCVFYVMVAALSSIYRQRSDGPDINAVSGICAGQILLLVNGWLVHTFWLMLACVVTLPMMIVTLATMTCQGPLLLNLRRFCGFIGLFIVDGFSNGRQIYKSVCTDAGTEALCHEVRVFALDITALFVTAVISCLATAHAMTSLTLHYVHLKAVRQGRPD